MAVYMNEHDIANAVRHFNDPETGTPNLARGARILQRLAAWTDNNSDGWAYWPKPRTAATRLITALQAATEAHYYRGGEVADLSGAQLRAMLSPIKSFLTKQKVDHGLILDDPVPVVHNIDVFRSGGGSDGEPRYLPACLTCGYGVGPICEDYGVALALASDHRFAE